MLHTTVDGVHLDYIDAVVQSPSPAPVNVIEEIVVYLLPRDPAASALLFVSPPDIITTANVTDEKKRRRNDNIMYTAVNGDTVGDPVLRARGVPTSNVAPAPLDLVAANRQLTAKGGINVAGQAYNGTNWALLVGANRPGRVGRVPVNYAYRMNVSTLETVSVVEGEYSPVFTLFNRQAVQLEFRRIKRNRQWQRGAVLAFTQNLSGCNIARSFACDITPPTNGRDDAYKARWQYDHSTVGDTDFYLYESCDRILVLLSPQEDCARVRFRLSESATQLTDASDESRGRAITVGDGGEKWYKTAPYTCVRVVGDHMFAEKEFDYASLYANGGKGNFPTNNINNDVKDDTKDFIFDSDDIKYIKNWDASTPRSVSVTLCTHDASLSAESWFVKAMMHHNGGDAMLGAGMTLRFEDGDEDVLVANDAHRPYQQNITFRPTIERLNTAKFSRVYRARKGVAGMCVDTVKPFDKQGKMVKVINTDLAGDEAYNYWLNIADYDKAKKLPEVRRKCFSLLPSAVAADERLRVKVQFSGLNTLSYSLHADGEIVMQLTEMRTAEFTPVTYVNTCIDTLLASSCATQAKFKICGEPRENSGCDRSCGFCTVAPPCVIDSETGKCPVLRWSLTNNGTTAAGGEDLDLRAAFARTGGTEVVARLPFKSQFVRVLKPLSGDGFSNARLRPDDGKGAWYQAFAGSQTTSGLYATPNLGDTTWTLASTVVRKDDSVVSSWDVLPVHSTVLKPTDDNALAAASPVPCAVTHHTQYSHFHDECIGLITLDASADWTVRVGHRIVGEQQRAPVHLVGAPVLLVVRFAHNFTRASVTPGSTDGGFDIAAQERSFQGGFSYMDVNTDFMVQKIENTDTVYALSVSLQQNVSATVQGRFGLTVNFDTALNASMSATVTSVVPEVVDATTLAIRTGDGLAHLYKLELPASEYAHSVVSFVVDVDHLTVDAALEEDAHKAPGYERATSRHIFAGAGGFVSAAYSPSYGLLASPRTNYFYSSGADFYLAVLPGAPAGRITWQTHAPRHLCNPIKFCHGNGKCPADQMSTGLSINCDCIQGYGFGFAQPFCNERFANGTYALGAAIFGFMLLVLAARVITIVLKRRADAATKKQHRAPSVKAMREEASSIAKVSSLSASALAGEARDAPLLNDAFSAIVQHVSPLEIRLDNVSLEVAGSSGGPNVKLLSDVNLTIQPGVVTALMGPSGAGKSTLLKVLSGKLRPTSGTISLNGRRVDGLHKYRGLFGYVPQDDVLHPELSVYEAVRHSAMMRLPVAMSVADKEKVITQVRATRSLLLLIITCLAFATTYSLFNCSFRTMVR
jgi:hypothetical protein